MHLFVGSGQSVRTSGMLLGKGLTRVRLTYSPGLVLNAAHKKFPCQAKENIISPESELRPFPGFRTGRPDHTDDVLAIPRRAMRAFMATLPRISYPFPQPALRWNWLNCSIMGYRSNPMTMAGYGCTNVEFPSQASEPISSSPNSPDSA